MSENNLRKTAMQVFACLQAEQPEHAAKHYVQLCVLCALERLDFLPEPHDRCWQQMWQGSPDAAQTAFELLHRSLPRIFEKDQPLLRLFAADGAACRLRSLYQSLPPQRIYGLSGRLWEACAELPRRQSFAALRRSGHHRGHNAAYATQLFTPGWLGHFLTENALGRLLGSADGLEYYMGDAPLGRTEAAQITLLDPCAGGGELLCRAFDLLYPRLLEEGMSPEDAVRHLLEKILCGLDLDENALNICRLELMLRGRSRDPLLWERNIQPQLAVVRFRNGVFCPPGSLFAPEIEGFEELDPSAAQLLSRQYDIVAANPPYMGRKGMSPALRGFLHRYYPDGKADLYAAFALRCLQLTKAEGFTALLMPQGWLTLSNFEALRLHCARYRLPVLLKLGAHAFPDIGGEVVQTAAFVLHKRTACGVTTLCDLSSFGSSAAKEQAFLSKENRQQVTGLLAAEALPADCRPLGETTRICQGLATGNNDRFVRLWYEVDPNEIARNCADRKEAAACGRRWFPYNKGGGFRRWWGNDLYVVDFADDGRAIRGQTTPNGRPRARVQNAEYYFRAGVTYSFVGSKHFSARITPAGAIFDVGGSTAFPHDGNCLTLAALLNSAAAQNLLLRRNPTVNFQVGDLAALPCPDLGEERAEVEALARICAELARKHWEETEPAPAFVRHPWAGRRTDSLPEAAECWYRLRLEENRRLAEAQHRLNQIFARKLGDDTPLPLPQAEIPDLPEECRRFLSWCVGQTVGRFGGNPADAMPLWQRKNSLADCVERLLTDLWGKENLTDALAFLAEQLNWRGDAHTALAEYFRGNFFEHHNKLYRNRPVYWLCPHKEYPVLLYYHNLSAATVKKLAKLRQSGMTEQLKQAKKQWSVMDKNLGIAPHILIAAKLGLAKLPPVLAHRQRERTNRI